MNDNLFTLSGARMRLADQATRREVLLAHHSGQAERAIRYRDMGHQYMARMWAEIARRSLAEYRRLKEFDDDRMKRLRSRGLL